MIRLMVLITSILSLFGCQSTRNDFENDTITYFSFSESGGMRRFSGFNYKIEATKDGKVHFLFNEGYPDEKEYTLDDHAVFDTIQQVILKHKIYKYSGHYQPVFDILDGSSWDLYVKYASKKNIDADGYMAGPNGYGEAFRELRQSLQYWADLPVASNDVIRYLYEYGPERYLMEKVDDHAVLTFDNVETGEHQVYERDLGMLDDVRILLNITGLKEDRTRGELEPGCTPWMFDVTFADGTHYRYETFDRDFQSGYSIEFHGFAQNCIEGKSEGQTHYIYY